MAYLEGWRQLIILITLKVLSSAQTGIQTLTLTQLRFYMSSNY